MKHLPLHPIEETDPFVYRKSHAYRQAFENYIRYGEPIRLFEAKATEGNRPTTHYIWRTQGDSKVRPSHRANDGKIFSWDDPPPTGHPGEDFGCRCFAQAYYPEVQEFAHQTLAGSESDAAKKWGNWELFVHFVTGGGSAVSLSQIGHLRGIIDYYANTLGVYERVNGQISDAARQAESGHFQYDFNDIYSFRPYLFSLGKSTVTGQFSGTVTKIGNALEISGTVTYEFRDFYTDTADIRQFVTGTSDPSKISIWTRWTEFGGTYFAIEDSWKTKFKALVNAEQNKNRYVK